MSHFITAPQIPGFDIVYLCVGGGGGCSRAETFRGPGGGGAGAVKIGSTTINLLTPIAITVGDGGAAQLANSVQGNDGTASSIAGIVTAAGGGGGGSSYGTAITGAGRPGGSGGGAGDNVGDFSAGGAATDGGFKGGDNKPSAGGGASGAGGGGASGAGVNATSGAGADGGAGILSGITGAFVTYGAGGRAENYNNASAGLGPGAPNTGSGANTAGGGASNPGGFAGGSGIVVIRYAGAPRATGGVVTQVDGYTIHKFTASGTLAKL